MADLKYFVSAEWLKERLYDGNVFVLDSRFDLFDPAGYGKSEYAKLHIDGAYYFDIDEDITEDKGEHGGRRGVPDPEVLGAKLAAVGIKMDSLIVCYDDGVYSAPRTWWTLKYIGYENVYVLDGGFYQWKAKGYPVSSEDSAPREGGSFAGRLCREMFADKDYVAAAVSEIFGEKAGCTPADFSDIPKVIVDSRGHERYTGEVEPLYSRPGHIPGAINIHYLRNMREEWLVGTLEQWRESFAPCLGKESILYCGSAIEAAINYMFFAELGERVRLYVGSMADWIGYDELEVEQGEGQA